MSKSDLEQRMAALEGRVRAAEDQLAIQNLLMTYGPLVDSATAEPAGRLWVEGGGYSFTLPDGGTKRLAAPDEISAMYGWPGHLDLVNTGCAHLTAPPRIRVDGDTAEAVGYSVVVLREGERWFLWRAAVNHWTLERSDDDAGSGPSRGWRITERVNRALDGSADSHEIMRRVLNL